MRALFANSKFLFNYVLWVLAGLVIYAANLIGNPSSSFLFLLTSVYLIVFPGYLIWRLLRLEVQATLRLLVFFCLGLVFYLGVNLGAIFLGLNLNYLIKIYEIILPLLFLTALILDFRKPFQATPLVQLRKLFQKENLLYLIPIILSIFIFLVIEAKGADFNGDPYYHLAIVRKVVENSPLNPASLVFSQAGSANPAYAYPAWHVFIGAISRVLDIDIFTAWSKMLLPLLVFALLAWWQFSKSIFSKKSYIVFGFIFFSAFTFFGNAGYLFQRLTVPDTLAQYVLMPLAFVFFLEVFFEDQRNHKKNSLLAISLILLLIVHGIHYFYVLLGILVFVLAHISIFRQNSRRSLATLFWTLFPLLVLALALEIKGGFISDTFRHFSGSENIDIVYDKFASMGLPFKYAFLLSPLLILFVRKEKKLLLILSLLILVPLIYWTPLRILSSRLLSFVFTNRLMGNVVLYYFIFSSLIGLAIIFIEKSATTLNQFGQKIFLYLLLAILAMMIILEIFFGLISRFTLNVFYSDQVSEFLSNNPWPIFVMILAIALVLFIWQQKKNKLIGFEEFTDHWRGLIFSALIAFILMAPSVAEGAMLIRVSPYLEKNDYTGKVISYELLGGQEAIDFVRAQIPKKSIIFSDQETIKGLSNLADLYMAYNLSSVSEQDLTKVFEENVSTEYKNEIITSPIYNVDYVYVRPDYLFSLSYFETNPSIFQKVYDGKAKIFKVKK